MSRHKARLLVAFAAVYVIWGSTYLAIRWAIETMPTFLMAGARFLVAGTVLYVWGRWRGAPKPTLANWRDAAIIGGLLLLGGNGGVVWAEQYVASGLAALLVATEPLWVILLDWARPGGTRPTGGEILGLVLGFGGVVLLIGPTNVGQAQVHPVGALVLIGATLSWAVGSLYSRGAKLPRAPFLTTGMNMLAGGALLTLVGTMSGQWGGVEVAAISLKSWLALLYLIVFGAIVGFTAYLWILREATLATASTYAYVNPVIAVFLGWALAGEAITPRIVAAAAVIVGSVVIITLARTPAFRTARSMVRRAATWTVTRRQAA
ncbi:MAG: drug/metabolite exporter YedA [Gemmatimonadetes bacterium]|nr:drug/metabolite exporter YedA [Gemmatimonadota bacterium]MBI2404403.1 drug/metabolite exporter YedA [Gemmatimonadota bacterium]MBI2537872.1 drug/metabolite exporter YedA [Gemmatimonadota bacterium]